jgi:1-acyl-sn-glycerol-3-phosphate acyltransferase
MHEALAYAFLSLLILAVAGRFCILFRRNRYTFAQSLLYFGCVLLTRILWRSRVPPQLPIGNSDGAVIVSNHRSSIDPFFFQLVAGRPVHWMVAREFCEHPAFRWFLKTCEVIPTGRGGIDTAATRSAIRHAESGELVGMFPEGRINMSPQFMLPSRPGAILIALRARVPVIPCVIEGSPYNGKPWSPLFMPAQVRVVFGEPMDLSIYYDCENNNQIVGQLMLTVMSKVAALAGQSDFEPQLAGKRWKPTEEELDAAIKQAVGK